MMTIEKKKQYMYKLGNSNQIDLQPRESKNDDTAKGSMRAIATSVLQKITGTDGIARVFKVLHYTG